ncbi:hypothetical protein CCACVL1_29109 [Corchorus capsularis]|uniref:Uncharacterized protein n=1 Tax=Corchorus capsularis TaxID=210143 RepID=A0A1R3G3W9_COCAP|nr:hypothetical protein CCACVL1_29109 [Corchorus capsularis]
MAFVSLRLMARLSSPHKSGYATLSPLIYIFRTLHDIED